MKTSIEQPLKSEFTKHEPEKERQIEEALAKVKGNKWNELNF